MIEFNVLLLQSFKPEAAQVIRAQDSQPPLGGLWFIGHKINILRRIKTSTSCRGSSGG